MEFLIVLWLPILVSAVAVFLVSSLFHVVLPLHRDDQGPLPNEAQVLESMRQAGVRQGEYRFPYCRSMKDMGSSEMVAKFEQGPVGMMTIWPNGPMAMGKGLLLWFLYSVLLGFLVAYVAHVVLSAGTESMTVFRVTGTIAVIGYAIGYMHDSIWEGRSWRVTFKFIFGGVVYGLVTGLIFSWMWPNA